MLFFLVTKLNMKDFLDNSAYKQDVLIGSPYTGYRRITLLFPYKEMECLVKYSHAYLTRRHEIIVQDFSYFALQSFEKYDSN